jgi:hypothetical protein
MVQEICMCRHWWLTPVIPATQEAEIRRVMVRSQPAQIVHKTLSENNPSQKRAGGVAQCEGPEFKPQDPTKICMKYQNTCKIFKTQILSK